MSAYLDASVLVALLGGEGGSQAAVDFVGAAEVPLLISDFAAGELASAVSRLVRTKMIDDATGEDRLNAFDEWSESAAQRIATADHDIKLAAQFVRRFDLGVRMPDAIHLACAQRHGFSLVTFDHHMAKVAQLLRISLIAL